MLNKYKNGEYEFLLFGENLPEPDEEVKLIEENVKLEDNQLLPIHEQYAFKSDRRLFNEGIETFNDLRNAYFLIKTKELQKSKSIRDLIVKKYETLSEYFNEQ
jgi:hypothetical protein